MMLGCHVEQNSQKIGGIGGVHCNGHPMSGVVSECGGDVFRGEDCRSMSGIEDGNRTSERISKKKAFYGTCILDSTMDTKKSSDLSRTTFLRKRSQAIGKMG